MDYVEKILLDNKIYPSVNGFDYFVYAVHVIENNKMSMTKLYKKIATFYKTSPTKVERDLRNIKNKFDEKISNNMCNKDLIFTLARYKTIDIIK